MIEYPALAPHRIGYHLHRGWLRVDHRRGSAVKLLHIIAWGLRHDPYTPALILAAGALWALAWVMLP